MLESEKLEALSVMSGEKDKNVLSTYLKMAGAKIIRKAYPFNPDGKSVPEEYSELQVEVALYMINKRGAEGETSHSENGIARSYEDGDVPPSLLRTIVPHCEVL